MLVVPPAWSKPQRAALLDAAAVAGLGGHAKLLNSHVAIAFKHALNLNLLGDGGEAGSKVRHLALLVEVGATSSCAAVVEIGAVRKKTERAGKKGKKKAADASDDKPAVQVCTTLRTGVVTSLRDLSAACPGALSLCRPLLATWPARPTVGCALITKHLVVPGAGGDQGRCDGCGGRPLLRPRARRPARCPLRRGRARRHHRTGTSPSRPLPSAASNVG